MTLTKQQVREVLEVYIRAWETQDSDSSARSSPRGPAITSG